MIFRRMTIAIKIQNFYVVYHESLHTIGYTLKKDFTHKLIHKYNEKTGAFKVLQQLLKDHRKILRLEGNRRMNIVLFLHFENPELSETRNSIKSLNTKLGEVQNLLCKIILNDFVTLKSILKKNPRLFLKMIKKLKIKGVFRREIKALKSFKKLNIREGVDFNRIKFNRIFDKTVIIHSEFCKNTFIPPVDTVNDTVNYQNMIDGIKQNKISTSILSENVFYPEITLYNEFLFSQIDPECFNKDLFDRDFTTENELIVKNFVKSRIDML